MEEKPGNIIRTVVDSNKTSIELVSPIKVLRETANCETCDVKITSCPGQRPDECPESTLDNIETRAKKMACDLAEIACESAVRDSYERSRSILAAAKFVCTPTNPDAD